jgi:hypothetical protein
MPGKVSSADPSSKNSDPCGNWFRYLRVKLHVKEIVILKFLLSKLLYSNDTFSEEDTVALFEAREKSIELCARDPGFNRKYLRLIFLTRNIFVNLEAFVQDRESITELRDQLEGCFNNGRRIIGPSIYFGGKRQFTVEMRAATPRKPKPRNRIGVGYRDKGTAKNTAWDGSPSWQEVAMSEAFNDVISESLRSKVERLQQSLAVLNNYRWQTLRVRRKPESLLGKMRG